jgi:hypothetical protein
LLGERSLDIVRSALNGLLLGQNVSCTASSGHFVMIQSDCSAVFL